MPGGIGAKHPKSGKLSRNHAMGRLASASPELLFARIAKMSVSGEFASIALARSYIETVHTRINSSNDGAASFLAWTKAASVWA